MKALHRYAVFDEYTLAEFRVRFENASATDRIALLEAFGRGGLPPYKTAIEYSDREPIPYEVAALAAADNNPEVRQWLVLNTRGLDYSREVDDDKYKDYVAKGGDLYSISHDEFNERFCIHHPDRNLDEKLRNDPEPLVRAAYLENVSEFEMYDAEERYFREASPFERLGFVRNKRLFGPHWVLRLFDREDQSLNLTLAERTRLLVAALSNEHTFSSSTMVQDWLWPDTVENFIKLWELAEQWASADDRESSEAAKWIYAVIGDDQDSALSNSDKGRIRVPNGTDRGVPVTVGDAERVDEIKAKAYAKIARPTLRRIILQGCSQTDVKTLALGLSDEDLDCRSIANLKIPEQLPPPQVPDEVALPRRNLATWNLRKWHVAFFAVALLLLLATASSNFERVLAVLLVSIMVYLGVSRSGNQTIARPEGHSPGSTATTNEQSEQD